MDELKKKITQMNIEVLLGIKNLKKLCRGGWCIEI